MLDGKTVLITGAARGMGAGIARACVDKGARVILTDLLADQVADTALELGPRASSHALDVTSEVDWSTLAAWMQESVGRPDVLVNNAGLLKVASVEETDATSVRQMMDVNVVGPLLGIQTFVRLHRETVAERPGSIINISSVRGLLAGAGFAGYAASKFAIRGLTKVAAVELGGLGIRVNSICPGPIESPMSVSNPQFDQESWATYIAQLPLGHIGLPVDIGNAVAWLGSDMSAFVTGVDLPVDGGLTATTYSVTTQTPHSPSAQG